MVDGIPTYKFTVRGSKKDLDGAASDTSDDDQDVSMAFAQKSLAKAIQARKEAAMADNEEAYKQAQEKVKMWTEHLNDFKKKQDTDEEPESNMLKKAGTLFNNLK